MVIYPVDSIVQPSNNWDRALKAIFRPRVHTITVIFLLNLLSGLVSFKGLLNKASPSLLAAVVSSRLDHNLQCARCEDLS